MTVKKKDLAEVMAEQAGIPKAKAMDALNAMVARIIKALLHGQRVEIRGLGSLRVRQRPAHRRGGNPAWGGTSCRAMPARNVVAWRTGKHLDEAINR